MGSEVRRRKLIRVWLPIALAVAVLTVLLCGSAIVVIGVAGLSTCPSPEWQQSARSEMEAITPTESRQFIFLSDCDDRRAVSYASYPGDVVAKGDAIVRLAESRGWQPVGADGSYRCLSKDLAGGGAYLSVGPGQEWDGSVAQATIVSFPSCALDQMLDRWWPRPGR